MAQRLNPSQWTPACAAHLLNRAGFGGSPAEVQALHALGLDGAVQRLLEGAPDDDLFPPPVLTLPGEIFDRIQTARRSASEDAKQELLKEGRREQHAQIRALRCWWLERMRYGLHPLREKMTLFWHGHFATGVEKVKMAWIMWQQNETFRARALGSFRSLTKEVSRDPAMMRYLDLPQSNRDKPNENFARELMELFLLGEGVRYTEDDIREAARAFTGYRIDPRKGSFLFLPRQFDAGAKTFLGKTGPFDGDAVIDILLAQPESCIFLARKLVTFFVSDAPQPALEQQTAATLRRSDWVVKDALREIFTSAAFYSPRVMRSQIKSPVQWLVQTARVLEAPLPSQTALEAAMSQLGQVLFAPPNVKGWEGGRAWISSATLLFRCNLAGYIVSGKAPEMEGFRKGSGAVEIPLTRIAPPALRREPAALCDALCERLLGARLGGEDRERLVAFLGARGPDLDDRSLRDFLHLLMSTPEYQLT